MPRQAKKNANITPAAYPDEAYGAGVDAIQAQKAVPIPDQATRLAGTLEQAAQPGPTGPATAAPAPSMDPREAAIQAAMAMAPQPSAVDEIQGYTEPMTSGLPYGAGPNTLNMGQRTDADLFNTMYQITGDPDLLLLAQRVRRLQQ